MVPEKEQDKGSYQSAAETSIVDKFSLVFSDDIRRDEAREDLRNSNTKSTNEDIEVKGVNHETRRIEDKPYPALEYNQHDGQFSSGFVLEYIQN